MSSMILGAFVLLAVLAVILVPDMILKKRKDRKESKPSPAFTREKAEWQWASVEQEYCKIHGITKEDLTEEDVEAIYEFCGMHISYFLTWAIQNDLMVEKDPTEAKLFSRIKTGEANGCAVLKMYDYKICREDFRKWAQTFLDIYYEKQYLHNYTQVTGSDDVIWCESFSYDKYFELEKLINQHFKKYKRLSWIKKIHNHDQM